MKLVHDDELEKIKGGSITGPVVSAFNEIIKVLFQAGEGLGSSIRRIKDNSLCPLE